MRRMVERGVMTTKERRALKQEKVSATQRFNIVLMWIMRAVIEGKKAKLFEETRGFDSQVLSKVTEIRAQANSIESQLRGRMVSSLLVVPPCRLRLQSPLLQKDSRSSVCLGESHLLTHTWCRSWWMPSFGCTPYLPLHQDKRCNLVLLERLC
jgi:hypothetical protein